MTIRDFIPDGEKPTTVEKKFFERTRGAWVRPNETPVVRDFIPDERTDISPAADPDEARQDALDKALNYVKEHEKLLREQAYSNMIQRNEVECMDLLNSLSEYERKVHLEEEAKGKNRKVLFDHFGLVEYVPPVKPKPKATSKKKDK